jgi:hypothetical protein
MQSRAGRAQVEYVVTARDAICSAHTLYVSWIQVRTGRPYERHGGRAISWSNIEYAVYAARAGRWPASDRALFAALSHAQGLRAHRWQKTAAVPEVNGSVAAAPRATTVAVAHKTAARSSLHCVIVHVGGWVRTGIAWHLLVCLH